ncbi:hypothetical protein MKW94_017246 [Papaver nudicaule]|uniref:Flavin-containing monooxygenase n=1 Tax=Papaver nudicaule TaxID=74823 RepID=A0AA41VTP6_PAPNU|nr:hypothetical protein [Papaver nudicaule]
MEFLKELEGKRFHDTLNEIKMTTTTTATKMMTTKNRRSVWVSGPVIVGAGPSGLAVGACLQEKGISSVILERANCIASLWQLKTYDRLRLHLPKKFCELPLMPFPTHFPTYPMKQQFVSYLEDYAAKFNLNPQFNETVVSAEFDKTVGFWRVKTNGVKEDFEYICRWLIVATGENAEEVVPEIEGSDEFVGPIVHTSLYKSGKVYCGKKVLVVGCGNSGMEVCLDLCNYNAMPSLVVRDTVHVLPRELLGKSTFGLSMWLLKWLPVRIVDRLLLVLTWLILGNTSQIGLNRPDLGPLELKGITGKTPVLDVGTLAKIRAGDIKVYPSVKRLARNSVEFIDGRSEDFDAVIMATGYKSNVPSWLKDKDLFSEKNGLPWKPFPNGWKGENGLYSVGFTKKGLLGSSMDARKIAQDIEEYWKADELKHLCTFTRRSQL